MNLKKVLLLCVVILFSQGYSFSDSVADKKSVFNELTAFALQAVEDPPENPEPLGQYLSRSSPTPVVYDTIVVGLGASGTAAAAALAQAGRKVLALEAQDRIGGRVYTVPFGDSIVELGAEWIHGTESSSTYELAMKNNITILPQNGTIAVYFSDGSSGREDIVKELTNFASELLDDPPEIPEPLGHYISRRVRDYVKVKYPSVANDTDFMQGVLGFLDPYILTYEAANSWDDVTTMSNFQQLGGNQAMSWHTYGYRTLFDLLLNKYNNGPGYPTLEVKLNSEVTKIQWPQDPQDNVLVTVKDGSTYTAKNVIVTLSVGVLKERYKTLFSPPLPEGKVKPIEAISLGVCAKMIFKFDQIWWPVDSLGFLLWKPVDKETVSEEDKWLLRVNTPGSSMTSNTTITIWACGDAAKTAETLPEEVLKTKIMGLMRRFMAPGRTVPEPINFIRSSWYSNPFTRGAYSYNNVDSPKYPRARAELAAPLADSAGTPRLLFAGEATESTRYGTVHGAVDSGRREANRILSATKEI